VNAVGHRQHRRAIAYLMREHDELVAAQTRDRVRLAHALRERLREGLQQHVADGVTVGIVHFLEAVEVDEEERGGVVAIGIARAHRAIDDPLERVSVGQTGERIGRCLTCEIAIRVAEPIDEHAQIHRCAQHAQAQPDRGGKIGAPPRLPDTERDHDDERRRARHGERALAVSASRADQKPEHHPDER